jgi:hypothetical protein
MGRTDISFGEEQRAKATIQALTGSGLLGAGVPGSLGQIAQEVFNTGPVMGADGVRDFGDVVTLGQRRDIGDMFRIGSALGLVDAAMAGSAGLGKFKLSKSFKKGIGDVAKIALPAVVGAVGGFAASQAIGPLFGAGTDKAAAQLANDPKAANVAAEGVIAARAVSNSGGPITDVLGKQAKFLEDALLKVPGGGKLLANARGTLAGKASSAGVGPEFVAATKPPKPCGFFARLFRRC